MTTAPRRSLAGLWAWLTPRWSWRLPASTLGTTTISTSPPSSSSRRARPPPGHLGSLVAGGGEIRAGSRRSGDFADPRSRLLLAAQRPLADAPWTWLRQVHGQRVVIVDHPGDRRSEEADAAVTACASAALVVRTADCAPVALASPEGVVGVVHAGWRA